MQNLPISIVIPVLNEATTLSELFAALDALLPKPAEVVFVDTGSDDCSVALIENWMAHAGNAHIKGQLCQRHGAFPGAARNVGIKAASQPWIAFLDAGIVPHADWLGKLWACQQRQGVIAVYGACRFHSADSWGRMICAVSYGQERTVPVLPASLFQRAVFEQAGYFEEGLRSGEDVRWKRNLACVGISVQDCDEALVEYVHFPSGLGGSLKKWFVYEQSATVAGLGGARRGFMLFAIAMLYCLTALGVAGAPIALACYLLLRGVVDPFRRSVVRPWWNCWWQPLLVIPIVAMLDLAAVAGRLTAMLGMSRYRLAAGRSCV